MAEKKRGPGRPPGSKNKNSAAKADKPKGGDAKSEKIAEMQEKQKKSQKLADEIWGVVILAVGIFLIFTTQLNTTGAFGDALHDILRGLFGGMAYILPYYFIVTAICLFLQKLQHINGRTFFFSALIFWMLCVLNSFRYIDPKHLKFGFGDIFAFYRGGVHDRGAGVFGMELGNILMKFFGGPGLIIFAIAVIIVSILLVVNTPISAQMAALREKRENKKLMRELELAEAQKAAEERREQALESFDRTVTNTNANRSVPNFEESVSNAGSADGVSGGYMPSRSDAIGKDEINIPRSKKSFFSFFGKKQEEPKKADSIGRYFKDDNAIEIDGSSPVVDIENMRSSSPGDFDDSFGIGLKGSNVDLSGAHSPFGQGGKKNKNDYDIMWSSGAEPSVAADPVTPIGKKAGSVAAAAAAGAVAGAVVGSAASKKKGASAENPFDLSKENEEIKREMEASKDTGERYILPPVELLKRPPASQSHMSEIQLQAGAKNLENTLRSFGVEAKVIKVTQGASVTRYEVQPAVGVKVNKIVSLSDDIALNLRAKSIRIEAPIPGKAAVGIEIENAKPSPVFIRELISSAEFRNAASKISFALGKDIAGNNIVANLKEMPHLLIAGATGSGKSVCINTIITSMLYKSTPKEVRFIMIDPKVVELRNYNGVPHMLIPVVTDPKKAASALNWAVSEMNNRYKEFAEAGVKDIQSYNEYEAANAEDEKKRCEIVIIIDELADLMMASPSQVEESICRLAQMGRAAGVHLIVATQRPSVDVVTGLIKANIPSRIAFGVSSQFDSRTILDMAGAEKLLGKGDMLFSPMNTNKPIRIQGAYISDSETAKVIDFVKKQGETEYDSEVIEKIDTPSDGGSGSYEDELTEDAIGVILKQKQASVSMLQRRFRIGYNRAARIIDEIEERGIIGASDGSRPRQVLITEEEYYGIEPEKEEESSDGEEK